MYKILEEELSKKKQQLEKDVISLELKIGPLEDELKRKREMIQHISRLSELEGDSSKSGSSEFAALQGTSSKASGTASSSATSLVPIFVDYNGQRYDAELDRSRIHGGKGLCVLFRGRWMATSTAGTSIPTKNLVNGWRFWRYCRSDGSIGMIQELRGV